MGKMSDFKTCRTCQIEKSLEHFYIKKRPARLQSGVWKTYLFTEKDCKKCANKKSGAAKKMKVFEGVHKEFQG